MEGMVLSLVVHWVVGEIAAQGAALDWAKLKDDVHAMIEGVVHTKWADVELEKGADAVVDAAKKACQDKADISAVLHALAGKDMAAAKAALLALVKPLLSGELSVLLSAA